MKEGSNLCFRTVFKDHNHDPQNSLIKELKMVADIKADCGDPSKIHLSVDEIMKTYYTGDPQEKVVFARIERNLQRIRKKAVG